MLHSIDSEILFLKQEDVIKAGLLDMKQILKVTEKTYELMGQGLIKNPPKVRTRIPDELAVIIHIVHSGEFMFVLTKEFPVTLQGKHVAVWIDSGLIYLVQGYQ